MMLGPKVLILDNYSASDGDLFPYQFKKLKIGTLTGTRSWGGVVGIRGSLPFIDGGDLRRPEFAPFDENGNWVIEGYGVDPDIVIENDPAKEYAGEDEQLNKAIEVILEQLKDYKSLPNIPEYPEFQENLDRALTPNIIDSLDHPVLQRLLGQQDTDSDIEEIY